MRHRFFIRFVISGLVILSGATGCGQIIGFGDLEKIDCDPAVCAGNGTGVPVQATALFVGRYKTCVILGDGGVACWGAIVGDGTPLIRVRPERIEGLSDTTTMSIAEHHACVLKANGDVYCWGDNDLGQLADGTNATSLTPKRIEGIPPVTKLSSGRAHTCVETSESPANAYCWGANDFGQVGNGDTKPVRTPVKVNLPDGLEKVSSGGQHTCAALINQSVYCWGNNQRGQLGVPAMTTPSGYSTTPVLIPDLGQIERVYGGDEYSCARTSSDTGSCWGANDYGQLGVGQDGTQLPESFSPLPVSGLMGISYFTPGGRHTCAQLDALGARCWGANDYNQLNLADDIVRTTPVPPEPVPNGKTGVLGQIETGEEHTCGIDELGEVYCFGLNDTGQLGNGTIGGMTKAARVTF
jgi:alpha-tubulin suppressor-like RCC1 family protein